MPEYRTIRTTHISTPIADVVMAGIATLKDLQTVYGCKDLYTLMEILYVNRINEYLIHYEQQQRQPV